MLLSRVENKRRSESVTRELSLLWMRRLLHPRSLSGPTLLVLTPDGVIDSFVRGETPLSRLTIPLSWGLAPDCLQNTPSSTYCPIGGPSYPPFLLILVDPRQDLS
jgi:hypothetical protein